MNLLNKIGEKARDMHYRIFGNRVTATAGAFAIAGLVNTAISLSNLQRGLDKEVKIDLMNVINEISQVTTPSALLFLFATNLGRGTYGVYKRTKKRIEEDSEVDERFFKKAVCGYGSGYCQRQGLYLAMRDAGLAEDFFRLRDKYMDKVKIPNF